MRLGVFADTHDHLDRIRLAVAEFNRQKCDLVLFAGDFVSTFAIPPLRKLECRLIACFGDNEGNRTGIRGGMEIIGEIADPPFGFQTVEGTKIFVTHQLELLRGDYDGADIVIFAHTHKPSISRDATGRLFLNPGETSGWSFGKPSIALLETATREASLIWLPRAGEVSRRVPAR
jgi:putative phosphoesterase